MTRNTGGPAFPHESYDAEMDMDIVQTGMTLRDWFAGNALAGMGTWIPGSPDAAYRTPPEQQKLLRAKWAYAQAEAMLRAREATK